MLTMSLLSTALSFFVVPVCSDLGFGGGNFTLYYSLMVAAGAVSGSFLAPIRTKSVSGYCAGQRYLLPLWRIPEHGSLTLTISFLYKFPSFG